MEEPVNEGVTPWVSVRDPLGVVTCEMVATCEGEPVEVGLWVVDDDPTWLPDGVTEGVAAGLSVTLDVMLAVGELDRTVEAVWEADRVCELVSV